ncbi:NEL-type E3 ubiquitin ligase domain-containing protein [Pseudomonas sp.]|uniref:NEL-type E3 ubiquitin ligase domain-containing protein n=1 Tax=Pseudomonas sp. TaxID=306 RepID=UPI0028ABE6F2|nr:NEL-type E3 ubiquitin ligase domain-containing protein [Pseudomonas sp.]
MSDHLAPTTSIDTLIAHRLPAWFRAALPEQRAALRRHLLAQQRAHVQAQRVLDAIPALPVFGEALLSPVLERELGCRLDVRTTQLDLVTYLPEASASLGIAQTSRRHTSRQSLLAAALHNFDPSETQATAFSSATQIVDAAHKPIALAPERFAQLCRTLDIGGQYQRQIKTVLRPEDGTRDTVEHTLQEAFRTTLVADACLARLRGGLDQDNYRRLLTLAAPVPVVPPDAHMLKAHEIRVLGKRINGVLAIEIRADASPDASLETIIAWIPGDPVARVSMHASWRALSIALAGRFAVPGYAAFFTQLLARADQLAFSQALARHLSEGSASTPMEIDGRHAPIDGDVFAHLRLRQVEGLLADAKVLAVPTDEENRKARAARLEGYVNAGLDLLGLVSLFVPGLGVAMLGVAALQLAHEVYEGYEDWQLGDREAALAHLFNVAEGIAGNALVAGAPVTGLSLAQRTFFVDGLAPVVGSSGTLRLLDPTLPGYASQGLAEGASSPTVRHIDTQAGKLRLERAHEHAHWRVVHPGREGAYSPIVESNETGGWWHALEQPQYWNDVGQLVRRLDSGAAQASDEAARFALCATGMTEDHLRGLHVEAASAPARLRDALQRYDVHLRFPDLKGEAFEVQVAAIQPLVQPAAQVLRRDFPGLTPLCANELVERATQAQVQRLMDEQRVPLALAQQARWALHDARLDRACAGLVRAQLAGRDTEKLALGLVEAVAPWPESVRIEIRQDTPQGPLLAHSTAAVDAEARVIVNRQGGYHCVDASGALVPGSRLEGTLTEALLLRLEGLQKLLLGQAELSASALGERLAEQANRSRGEAARILGMTARRQGFRPPSRLGDGRVGYPLSGRGESSQQAFSRGLLQLYPTFSASDVEALLSDLRARGIDPWNYLHELHQQLATLRSALETWQAEPGTLLQSLRRREVASRLRRCWRRKRGGSDSARLVIEGERVGQLPSLPESVDFGHVQELVLRDMALAQIPASFLGRFPNLRLLDVRHNQLARLPDSIETLVHLRQLRLGHNRIVWDAQSDQRIAALTHLNRLELDGNPLQAVPNLATLRHLRDVSLRGTLTAQMPDWVRQRPFVERVDLRDNAIGRLQSWWSEFFLRRLSVHDNPLESTSMDQINQAMQVGQAASQARDIAHTHVPVDTVARDHWLGGASDVERAEHQSIWDGLEAEPGSGDLLRFFADLAHSNEYLRRPKQLRARVWRILRACERDSQVREALFQQAAGPRTCSDRELLVLSQLEVGVLVAERTQGHVGAAATRMLLKLGRSLYRLDEVDRLAAGHIERLRARPSARPVDDIEVIMSYRVYLSGPLGLPEQPDYMYFGSYSPVTASDINLARTTILAAETDRAVAESLVQRDFWIDHLRQRFGHLIEEMNAPFHVRLEGLEGWSTLFGEQAYLDKVEQLAAERKRAEHALLLRLTLEEVELAPH